MNISPEAPKFPGEVPPVIPERFSIVDDAVNVLANAVGAM